MTFGFILLGLIGLFLGGEALVRGSVAIARKLKLSELVIGLTLVGFGTSMPELVTTLQAAGDGQPGIALGNVVGSNIANVMLVLGIAALISPIVTQPRALARDMMVMIVATCVFIALVWFDMFNQFVGLGLIGFLVAYVVASLVLDQRAGNLAGEMHSQEGELVGANYPLFVAVILALLGVAGVIYGARYLVTGAVQLADMVGLSGTVVGLTIVAVGTSLPELAASAIAALRGRNDVALGNIIGSNIFNVTGIIGATALVHPSFSVVPPEPVAGSILNTQREPQGFTELPIIGWEHMGALILSVFLLVIFALTGKRIARWEGVVLLLAYVLYLGLILEWMPTPFDGLFGGAEAANAGAGQ